MSERSGEGGGCGTVIGVGALGAAALAVTYLVHYGPEIVGQAVKDPSAITFSKVRIDFKVPNNFGPGATGTEYTGNDPAQITVNTRLSQASAEKLFGVPLQTGGENNTGPTAAQIQGIQEIAFAIGKNTYGWGTADDKCEKELWNGESGWSSQAHNVESADGIPQDLMSVNGAETLQKFPDFVSNPVEQVQWGTVYIHDRYGDPCKANYFWHNVAPGLDNGNNWYKISGSSSDQLGLGFELIGNSPASHIGELGRYVIGIQAAADTAPPALAL
jgi:hypothetical protein